MKAKTIPDYPAGYLTLEDKINMMLRLQTMQIAAKQNQLDQYGSPDYTQVIKDLGISCSKEVKALDKIVFEEED